VRAWTAALAQADLAERQVDLIEDDEQGVGREPIAVEQLPHGSAAVVHERLRSRDRDAQITERALGDARLGRLGVELQPRSLRQLVSDLEANVMSRVRIAVTRVTKTDNEPIDAWR
jgi:hypothetical protein